LSDPKSTDRLRRVRGLSKYNLQVDTSPQFDRDESAKLFENDLIITLIKTKNGICAAILLAHQILYDKKHVDYVNINHLSDRQCVINGRLLKCVTIPEQLFWYFDLNECIRECISIPGALIQCLTLPQPLDKNDDMWYPGGLIYKIETRILKLLIDSHWEKISNLLAKFPVAKSTMPLPYRLADGKPGLLCESANAENSVDDPTSSKWICFTCRKSIDKKKMWLHIGIHIVKNDVSSCVCGFCGRISHCSIALQRTVQKTIKVISNCPFFFDLQYGRARKISKSSPCTNVPVECPICYLVVWKYGWKQHQDSEHEGGQFEKKFLETVEITEQEIKWMKSL